ncbi:MAG: hypothetical protein C4520_07025, partial [Candidatus Abyssobacteria bacterium SURF_5]
NTLCDIALFLFHHKNPVFVPFHSLPNVGLRNRCFSPHSLDTRVRDLIDLNSELLRPKSAGAS